MSSDAENKEGNEKEIEEEINEEIEEELNEFADNLVKEIEEANKEETEEEIKEDVQMEGEGDIDLAEKSNKRIKITNESSDEEEVAEILVATATEEISSGVNATCNHPVVVKNLCGACGKFVEKSGSRVTLNYILPDMSLEASELERERNASQKKLLKDKKLILVLDLDFTLLNSVVVDNLIEDEEYLFNVIDDEYTDDLVLLNEGLTMTKMRPFIHNFLAEANEMFEMYISTMGREDYAKQVAERLDPDNVYFPSRVISRYDHTNLKKKGLDIVLGLENVIVALDDTEDIWEDHKENLIVMEKYYYFAFYTEHDLGFDWDSLSVLKRDERESDGALASILHVLKRVHKLFYDSTDEVDPASRDVRQILASIKMDVLKGCSIVFSGVVPSDVQPSEQQLWILAEGMGATCFTDVNDSVTHVVAANPTTMEAGWARDNNKFLVTTRWVMAAHYLWRRPKEEDFPLPPLINID